ncbi:TPA: DUF2523 family protein [Vibrio parahaemolyticus]|nr:hypothetical protein [Vibrio parahaemolyticus]
MLNDALIYILKLFKQLATTIFDVVTDVFLFVLDSLMTAVIILFNGFVDLLEFMNFSEYYDYLPSEFIDGASALGLGQIFTIIISAHAIKIILQLIPFVRLGAK